MLMDCSKLLLLFVFFVILPLKLYGESYILKFNSASAKKEFLKNQVYATSLSFDELPFVKAIENLKRHSDRVLSFEQDKILNRLSTYLVIETKDYNGKELIARLISRGDVEFVEPNYVFSVEKIDEFNRESFLEKQWYLNAINAKAAWKKSTGKGIIVGIIDTGIDFEHRDLANQFWINSKEDINGNGKFEPWPDTVEINGLKGDLNGIDDDGNGFVDDVIGYDFVDQSFGNIGDFSFPDPIPQDENGHGTMVAGVLAAGINDTGIVGVAPEVRLVALRSFDLTGNAEVRNIASAIIYAALNNVKILNFSFGSRFDSKLLHDAIRFAYSMGCIMVASAGNDGEIVGHYPSDYPEVISVGATNLQGKIGRSSNYGPKVDIFAPGYEIFTLDVDNSYKYVNGTSFSAPIIAGVIALLLEMNSHLTLNEIKSILQATGKKLESEKKSFGQCIVDASSAMNFIGSSKCEIIHPLELQEINKDEQKNLKILYRIYSPFFESYDLQLFKNDTGFIRSLVFKQGSQSLLDSIFLDLTSLETGEYLIKLTAELLNKNKIVSAVKFYIYSNDSKLKIKNARILNTLFEGKNLPIVACETNLPSYFKVTIVKDSTTIKTFADQFYSTAHSLPLFVDSDFPFSIQSCKVIVELSTRLGMKIYDTLGFPEEIQIFQRPIKRKFNTLPLSYIFPCPIHLNQINRKGILLNPYRNLQWNDLRYYQFFDSIFVEKSVFPEALVPVDVGNTNSNAYQEILTTSYGKTVVFEPPSEESFFGKVLFQSKSDEILWASQLYDLNIDGKEELICYDDLGFKILSFDGKEYKIVSLLSCPDTLGRIGTKPNLRIGDFDGDGNIEFIFITTSGYLLVYQLNRINLTFSFEHKLKLNGEPGSYITCSANVYSEQTKPFVFILQARNLMNADFDIENSTIWNLFALNSDGFDSYKLQEVMSFWGARVGATPQGIFYRNGINATNIDYQIGDELLVSVFPNLYVLKFDLNNATWHSTLWLPFVYSNAVVSDDFDNDGILEFGVSQWDGMHFYQFESDKILSKPLKTDGWIDNNDSVYLKWDKVLNANKYQIFRYDRNLNSLEYFQETIKCEFSFPRFMLTGTFSFLIRAIDTTNNYLPSQFSSEILIVDTVLLKPFNLIVSTPQQVILNFFGKLPDRVSEVVLWVRGSDNVTIDYSSLAVANDTMLIITFSNPLPNGNFKLIVGKFRDYYGNYSYPATFEFEVNFKPLRDSLLVFKRFNFLSLHSFEIEFAEDLDRKTALDVENYSILPFGTIERVELVNPNKINIEIASYPNIYSLGKDFYLILGKIYNLDSSKSVQPPFNTICITREASEIENAYAYPNPIKLRDDRVISFANIGNGAIIELFDPHLNKVGEFINESWKGGIQIDLTQQSNIFSTGIYYFRIRKQVGGNWISSSLKKFAIIY